MMGPRQVAQAALFYESSIEEFVPQDHPMRGIDRFLDLTEARPMLAPYYSANGRPSINPELMIYYPAVHVYMHESAHAAVGLLHGHPIRATALRRGAYQSGLQVVLQA